MFEIVQQPPTRIIRYFSETPLKYEQPEYNPHLLPSLEII